MPDELSFYTYIAETAYDLVYVGHGRKNRARRSDFTGQLWVHGPTTKRSAWMREMRLLSDAPAIRGYSASSIRRPGDLDFAGFDLVRGPGGDLAGVWSMSRMPFTNRGRGIGYNVAEDLAALEDLRSATIDDFASATGHQWQAARRRLLRLVEKGYAVRYKMPDRRWLYAPKP